jgi:hypothetical protein
VAEEGWRGVSDTGEPVVAGADAGGSGGAVEEWVRGGRECPLIAYDKDAMNGAPEVVARFYV